jgi:hypothetical protein
LVNGDVVMSVLPPPAGNTLWAVFVVGGTTVGTEAAGTGLGKGGGGAAVTAFATFGAAGTAAVATGGGGGAVTAAGATTGAAFGVTTKLAKAATSLASSTVTMIGVPTSTVVVVIAIFVCVSRRRKGRAFIHSSIHSSAPIQQQQQLLGLPITLTILSLSHLDENFRHYSIILRFKIHGGFILVGPQTGSLCVF